MYMRNSAAAIIMYDVISRQSFEDVDKWAEAFALVLEDLCNDLSSSASAEEIYSVHSVTRTDVVRLPSSSSSVSSKDSKAKTRCCAFL
ncbi:hypothetical protein TELCIR_10217 [Teladorsagia circumcincta]|uniref:Ras family protein n=1 Tax=Teladorsagia circumcincta TaxID=45464 RepID=A0A2G9UCW9_TELCI|nr:hypothetical protein TELCIR_10217 [Teladorsagia circumcincta]